MAKSAIAICNITLSALGERSIRSFEEDNQRARLCENVYDFAVEHVLAQLDWPFARSYYPLREDLEPPFTFEDGRVTYELPPDCVVPRDVEPIGSDHPWDLVGNYIVMVPPSDSPILRYTKLETNPVRFSAAFSSLVADFMMTKLAGPLRGSKVSEVMKLVDVFNFNLANITVIDANIGHSGRHPDDDADKSSFNRE